MTEKLMPDGEKFITLEDGSRGIEVTFMGHTWIKPLPRGGPIPVDIDAVLL